MPVCLFLIPENHLNFELLVNTEEQQNIMNLSCIILEKKGLVVEGMKEWMFLLVKAHFSLTALCQNIIDLTLDQL